MAKTIEVATPLPAVYEFTMDDSSILPTFLSVKILHCALFRQRTRLSDSFKLVPHLLWMAFGCLIQSVLEEVCCKKIDGSDIFWHELILPSIGELALMAPRHGFKASVTKFTSKIEPNDYLTDIVVELYTVTAIHSE
jgi:hypothetical protein